MAIQTRDKKQNLIFQNILEELELIRQQLQKLLVLIPEESLKDYKNSSQIKKAYFNALKDFPPK